MKTIMQYRIVILLKINLYCLLMSGFQNDTYSNLQCCARVKHGACLKKDEQKNLYGKVKSREELSAPKMKMEK